MPPKDPLPSSPPPPNAPHSSLPLIFTILGAFLGLLFFSTVAFVLYKRHRRALRRAQKRQKLAGTGHMSVPASHARAPLTDEEKLRASMGVRVPMRVHVDAGPPVTGQGGRGGAKGGSGNVAATGERPVTPTGSGFKWEEDDSNGMRSMMRKLSISSFQG